jgi:uncharacterized Zn-finger protein
MKVVTIPAVDVTIGMKMRSFTSPDTFYTIESIKEMTTGREFGIRWSKDMKFKTSFFATDENCKILVEDNELMPIITVRHIQCPYCDAQFLKSLVEINQKTPSECPDCERTFCL